MFYLCGMENKVVGFIPKLLYKLFLTLKNKFDPPMPVPEEERFTIQICEKLLEDPDSKLTFAPIANKRFIKNETKDMFVVIHEHSVNLINHVYSYSIYVTNTSDYNSLIGKFDKVLDNKRLKLEDEIKLNIQHSLEQILKKLN